ncbi:MAG: hypothetical protein V8Q30_12805 [Acutalibacteraceae bacterium]
MPTGERLEIPMLSDKASVQAYIDDLYRRGYMVMINHPFWSRIEYDEILGLNNLFAVEIFNYCSQILENMGESNVCYDALLRNGMKLWCTAVDDNHNDFPLDSAKCDSFGGFVQVKAEELSERAICNALASGSFYASMGPESTTSTSRTDASTSSVRRCRRSMPTAMCARSTALWLRTRSIPSPR